MADARYRRCDERGRRHSEPLSRADRLDVLGEELHALPVCTAGSGEREKSGKQPEKAQGVGLHVEAPYVEEPATPRGLSPMDFPAPL